MKILVVGAGYVGLVTGTCFAEVGHEVTILDIDEGKIKRLLKGEIPIYEPGLEEMVKRNIASKRLHFTLNYAEAVNRCDFIFIAVDTPIGENGNANITYVLNVAKGIAEVMKSEKIIVTKSTVPPGTSHKVKSVIESITSVPFSIVNNPEFLKEGNAINDFMKPDRVVVGVESSDVGAKMKELYAPFMINHERFIVMDILSSELTKYAANAMLATRISFMNEMARLCELLGADINKIRVGIGSDQRIGHAFLYAGAGFGGSCFPKDLQALRALGVEMGCTTPLLDSVIEVNQQQKRVMVQKIESHFENNLSGKTVAVWGLSFKPYTDDMREAPSLVLIKELLAQGASLRLYDPIAMPNAMKMIADHPNLTFCKDEFDASLNADAIVLMTEWKQFRLVDRKAILKTMRGNAFFDGRNQYDPLEMAEDGFIYYSIGRNQETMALK
jgi:nucleotide sugar dehydrogenase